MSCPICIDSPVDIHTSCGHSFCKPCLDRWVKTCRKKPTCPLCRTVLPKPKQTKIQGDQDMIQMANYIMMIVLFILSIYLLKIIAIIVNGLIIIFPKLFIFYSIINYIYRNGLPESIL